MNSKFLGRYHNMSTWLYNNVTIGMSGEDVLIVAHDLTLYGYNSKKKYILKGKNVFLRYV